MAAARDHLDPGREPASTAAPHRPDLPGHAPAIAGHHDPRLAHGGAAPGLLQLQRTAGNAAVSSLVAPAVQREVQIDEMTSEVGGAGAGPTTPTGDAGPGDAGERTITGSVIRLAAPITHADGVLEADTVVANNIVAANYTPGAGNVW
jgi:hypothetical protein